MTAHQRRARCTELRQLYRLARTSADLMRVAALVAAVCRCEADHDDTTEGR